MRLPYLQRHEHVIWSNHAQHRHGLYRRRVRHAARRRSVRPLQSGDGRRDRPRAACGRSRCGQRNRSGQARVRGLFADQSRREDRDARTHARRACGARRCIVRRDRRRIRCARFARPLDGAARRRGADGSGAHARTLSIHSPRGQCGGDHAAAWRGRPHYALEQRCRLYLRQAHGGVVGWVYGCHQAERDERGLSPKHCTKPVCPAAYSTS